MQARRWQQIPLLLGCVALLWGIECVNALLGHRLNRWGILPRTFAGLVGIPLSPFLHGSFAHLILNTVPLVTLGSFADAVLYFLGGPLVWIARWCAGGAAGQPTAARHAGYQPDGTVSAGVVV